MAKGSDFYLCGEITMSLQIGKKVFVFNCTFCTTICSQIEAFISHIEENHYNELYDDTSKECSIEKSDDDPLCATKLNFPGHQLKIQNNEITIAYDDPLEEAPMSVDSEVVSLSTKHEKKDFQEYFSNFGTEKLEDSTDNEIYNTSEEPTNDLSDSSEDESTSATEPEIDKDDDKSQTRRVNRDLLLALISGYEKNRILWDPKDANAKNKKKREAAIKKIGHAVKGKLNIALSNQEVTERINKIRDKFRSELQNQRCMEIEGGVYTTPSIYFKKLAFLKNVITYKPRNKRGTKALTNEKPALPLPNLTDAQNVKFIEIYKSFPCLWDTQHIGFRFKAQRTEAVDGMIKSIRNKINLNLTQEELLKKLYRIRYACTQDKHRKLECERMQTEFRPSSKYFQQISFLVDNVGPFKCDFCEQIFNGADQYKIHKSKHDGSMPFVCPICSRGFMKVGNCTVHVRRHTRDYAFECKVCAKRFATTTDVNVHMRYHTGEKPYFCEVCGQSFRTWSFFNAHMRRHQKQPSHICKICEKAFYENNKLTEHMKAHLNVRDKICNICGKAFTSSKYLRQHKQIHAEKKKYVCKICKKDFAQYAGLSGHMKSHGTTISGGAIVEDQH